MSLERAKSYIERMKTDADFRKKVNECKNTEERAKVVKEMGFNFTAQELKSCTDELTDDELSAVAGGILPRCQGKVQL